MAAGDTARLYHELTSYTPEREWTAPIDDPRVRQDFVPNDFERWPAPCKAYPPGLPAVELPRRWPAVAAPATRVLAGRHTAAPACREGAQRRRGYEWTEVGALLHMEELELRKLEGRGTGSKGKQREAQEEGRGQDKGDRCGWKITREWYTER